MRVAYLEREKEEAGALREGGGVGREILKWLACQRVALVFAQEHTSVGV